MTDTWGETLSSLVDGDDVDVETLRSALASEAGREMLAQFAALRAAVRADQAAPARFFTGRMTRELERPTLAVPSTMPRLPYPVAAALALTALLLGFGVDAWRHKSSDGPPRASRVLQFEDTEWTNAPRGGQ